MPSGISLFKKIGQRLPDVARFQDNVEQTFLSLTNKAIIDGVLIDNVNLTTSASDIAHGLGKPVTGYIVIKRNANAVVYDNEQTNTKRDRFLNLQASATVTVSLWVF